MPLTKPFRRFPGECCRKLLCKLAEIWVMWHAKELEGIRHQMCQEEFFLQPSITIKIAPRHKRPKKHFFFVAIECAAV